MSDPGAMLGSMHKCDCGFVLVASDDPEPMGNRLVHYIRPLILEYRAYQLDLLEWRAIFEFSAFLWNLATTEDIPRAIRMLELEMPARLRFPAPKARTTVRELLTRRSSQEFADDDRLALQLKVNHRGGRVTSVKAVGVRFEPDPSHAPHDPLPPGIMNDTEPKGRRVLH